jgi:hypothetical protein
VVTNLRPGHFTPRERAPGIHSIGGWVGSRASLDTVSKREILNPRRESNPGCPACSRLATTPTEPSHSVCPFSPTLSLRALELCQTIVSFNHQICHLTFHYPEQIFIWKEAFLPLYICKMYRRGLH